MSFPRFTIGIDLGTTNCALAYIDSAEPSPRSRILPIRQLESPGKEQELPFLPSFLFLPAEPSERPIVGAYAREQLAYLPGRVIHSAKSWLVHASVDREAKLLPWGSEEISQDSRLSPVEASAHYLSYLKALWDETVAAGDPEKRFDRQRITITVPASFDEVAQNLTLKAESHAGFGSPVMLLEEPQAAFYHWLESHAVEGSLTQALLDKLPALASCPQSVLVCDIGGGTTDFSLFEIKPPSSPRALPEISRTAVSDHLLLGGDNIDLAIARALEQELLGNDRRLKPRQWMILAHQARHLKEKLLGTGTEGDPAESFHVAVPGEGVSLLAKPLSASLTRQRLKELVLEGFYPFVGPEEKPRRLAAALREWGLPFAPDSRVTAHLAAFLGGHEVDAVLFTGGSLKPLFLQERLLTQLEQWQGRRPVHLKNTEMDLAVARGAAYYGAVLTRPKSRIQAGYAHTIYVEAEATEPGQATLVCLLPRGAQAGQTIKIRKRFRLLVDKPARFQLYTSNRREGDKVGELVRLIPEQFHPLPPLQTELKLPQHMSRPKDGLIDVGLEAAITETGLLRLFAVHQPNSGEPERWQLEFNLRRAAETQGEEVLLSPTDRGVPEAWLRSALQRIRVFYGARREQVKENPKGLIRDLEKILHREKEAWEASLLRALWPGLSEGLNTRGRSAAHEQTWFYLAGFTLRPGYGADLDPWRIRELWKSFRTGVIFANQKANTIAWWVLWRRVAGGLDASQQEALWQKAQPQMGKPGLLPEIMLAVGALERLEATQKIQAGEALLRQLFRHRTPAVEACLWALGRLAARTPLYAGAQAALPGGTIEGWIKALLDFDLKGRQPTSLNLFLTQACRLTGDRNRDVPDDLRKAALERMILLDANETQRRALQEMVEMDTTDQAKILGEALPTGLKLV